MVPENLKKGGDSRENWKTINLDLEELRTVRRDVIVLKRKVAELEQPGLRKRGGDEAVWLP